MHRTHGWSSTSVSSSCDLTWRQIWRVAGRESSSPELLGSPRTSPKFPGLPRKFFGDFPGSSLTVELSSNPEVPRKFPTLPRKFPKLPRKFPDFPGGQPLSLGSLTPSPDSQKLSLTNFCGHGRLPFHMTVLASPSQKMTYINRHTCSILHDLHLQL